MSGSQLALQEDGGKANGLCHNSSEEKLVISSSNGLK